MYLNTKRSLPSFVPLQEKCKLFLYHKKKDSDLSKDLLKIIHFFFSISIYLS